MADARSTEGSNRVTAVNARITAIVSARSSRAATAGGADQMVATRQAEA